MKLNKEIWERTRIQAEKMVEEAVLQQIHAELMMKRAENELKKFPKICKPVKSN